MAKITAGFFSKTRGKVGSVITQGWRGKNVVRQTFKPEPTLTDDLIASRARYSYLKEAYYKLLGGDLAKYIETYHMETPSFNDFLGANMKLWKESGNDDFITFGVPPQPEKIYLAPKPAGYVQIATRSSTPTSGYVVSYYNTPGVCIGYPTNRYSTCCTFAHTPDFSAWYFHTGDAALSLTTSSVFNTIVGTSVPQSDSWILHTWLSTPNSSGDDNYYVYYVQSTLFVDNAVAGYYNFSGGFTAV